jgi:hypothetical protein
MKTNSGKQSGRSPNMRFCKMAAVTPQTILWKIVRLSPAGGSMKPPPRKAAGTLGVRRGQRSANIEAKKRETR